MAPEIYWADAHFCSLKSEPQKESTVMLFPKSEPQGYSSGCHVICDPHQVLIGTEVSLYSMSQYVLTGCIFLKHSCTSISCGWICHTLTPQAFVLQLEARLLVQV